MISLIEFDNQSNLFILNIINYKNYSNKLYLISYIFKHRLY
jgi:hypothetical protein